MIINISSPEGRRFEAGLEFIAEGKGGFNLGQVQIYAWESSPVTCSVVCQWSGWPLSENVVGAELGRGRMLVEDLQRISPAFSALVASRGLAYELIDDYGNGSVVLLRVPNKAEADNG